MGRRKRVGPLGADGFSAVGQRAGRGAREGGRAVPALGESGGDSPFAPGVPRGSVPEWSCNCGRDRIWGTHRSCPGCGRLAPDRIQRLQSAAVARARGAASGSAPPSGVARQGTTQNERIADLEAEIHRLRAAADSSDEPPAPERIKLPPRTVVEVAADKEVADLETSLAQLRGCTHPGKDKQVEDLQALIARTRECAHAAWHPLRHRLRLEQRLRDSKEAVGKVATQHQDLLQQQEDLANRISEIGTKAAALAATVATRQTELDDFDRRNPAPAGPDAQPVLGSGPMGSTGAALPPPSWQHLLRRVELLGRTGLPAEVALRQASAEASSPSGLRLGAAVELELGEIEPEDQHSHPGASDVEFEEDEDDYDDIVDEFAGSADAEATFTRAQLRDILSSQRSRAKAAAKTKRRRTASSTSGTVRQPAFTNK